MNSVTVEMEKDELFEMVILLNDAIDKHPEPKCYEEKLVLCRNKFRDALRRV